MALVTDSQARELQLLVLRVLFHIRNLLDYEMTCINLIINFVIGVVAGRGGHYFDKSNGGFCGSTPHKQYIVTIFVSNPTVSNILFTIVAMNE